jgi:hypothetical protein
MTTLRGALAHALHEAFLMSAIVACGALVAAFFLREIPLRKRQAQQAESALIESGKELAIEGLTNPAPLPADNQSQPRLQVAPPIRPAGGR